MDAPRCGPGANWAAELKITYVRAERRAGALGVAYNGRQDPVPWDAALVEIFATLLFLLDDAGGFPRGEPAYPNKIELDAPELPDELRGTVVAGRCAPAST